MRTLCRSGVIAFCLLFATGCFLDREPFGATPGEDGGPLLDGSVPDAAPRDAGPGDAAPHDAGPGDAGETCPTEGCDDGNPCTDDSCVDGRCVHTPNTADCTDGIFCNGEDRCEGGVCVPSDIDPCPGMSTCNPVTDMCEGCAGPADCPEESQVTGPCTYESMCAIAGEASVTVTSYVCIDGGCVAQTSPGAPVACTRDTAGTTCGTPMVTEGECVSTGGVCATTGSRTVTTTTPLCAAGACSGTSSTSRMEACTRTTDGIACGCSDWSPCYTLACGSTSGERFRLCSECAGGACTPAEWEDEVCSPVTGCITCGTCNCTTNLRTCTTGTCAGTSGTCNTSGGDFFVPCDC